MERITPSSHYPVEEHLSPLKLGLSSLAKSVNPVVMAKLIITNAVT
jgi:hypothetical protein